MTPRLSAFVVAAVLLVYLVLMSGRAVIMIASGQPVFIVLGLAVFVLPVLGAVLVVDQLRFGVSTERLARRLFDEHALPDVSHLPQRSSGRVVREAADAWFDEKQAELEAAPQEWRSWFALAHAYELAGDRKRGRRAMRRAIELESEDRLPVGFEGCLTRDVNGLSAGEGCAVRILMGRIVARPRCVPFHLRNLWVPRPLRLVDHRRGPLPVPAVKSALKNR